jgi:hypothetical protein
MFVFSTKGATLRLICLFDPANFARRDVVEELVGGFTRHLDRICDRLGRNTAVQARQGRELSKNIQTEQAMPRRAEGAGRDG